jgi:hypothetical protein
MLIAGWSPRRLCDWMLDAGFTREVEVGFRLTLYFTARNFFLFEVGRFANVSLSRFLPK